MHRQIHCLGAHGGLLGNGLAASGFLSTAGSTGFGGSCGFVAAATFVRGDLRVGGVQCARERKS